MNANTLSFGSKNAAYQAAKYAGHDRDAVKLDVHNGRYVWSVIDAAPVAAAPTVEAPTVGTDDATELNAAVATAGKASLQGRHYPEDKFLASLGVEAPTVTIEAVAEGAATEVAVDTSPAVEAPTEEPSVAAEPVAEVATVPAIEEPAVVADPITVTVADVLVVADVAPAEVAPIAQPVLTSVTLPPVAIAEPATPVDTNDYYVRISGKFDIDEARMLATSIANATGRFSLIVNADTNEQLGGKIAAEAAHGTARARTVRASTIATGAEATAALAPRASKFGPDFDWLTFTPEMHSEANKSCRTMLKRITDAGAAGDLDALLALDFAGADPDDGTGNTYTRYNGRVRLAWIAKLQADMAVAAEKEAARQAALDAEFGYGAIAA